MDKNLFLIHPSEPFIYSHIVATKIINVLKDDNFEDILDIFKNASAKEFIFVLPKKHKAFAEEEHFTELAGISRADDKKVLILTSNPEISNLALRNGFGILTSEKKEPKPPKNKIEKKTEPIEEEKIEDAVSESVPEADSVETPTEPEVTEEVVEEPVEDIPIEEEKNEERESDWESEGGSTTSFEAKEPEVIVEEFPEVELTAVKRPTQPSREAMARPSKMMSDIIKPVEEEEEVKINIANKSERSLSVNIKKEMSKVERKPIDPERSLARAKSVSPKDLGEATSYGVDDIESVWQARPTGRGDKFVRKSVRPIAPIRPTVQWRTKLHFFNLRRKAMTFFGVGVVILFAVVIYVSTGNARIIIKPRAYPVDLSMKVMVSDQFSETDSALKKIPGQLFTINKTVEETFPATGERDVAQKAKGKLIAYNEYGTTPQVLVATTRFESSKGFVFRTLKTVTIPGTTVQNGKITPGSIEIEIIADKAGEAYNIEPGRFTIPAFKEKGDNDRYQKFYGVSKESMTGGIVGKAKVVTDEDYMRAKEAISKKLIAEADQELKDQAAGLKILGLSTPTLQDPISTAKPDEAANTFIVSQTAEIQTVGFKESDLYELLSMYVGGINNLMILPEKLELEFKDIKFNKEQKILEFIVVVKGLAYGRVDQDKMTNDLIGKKEKDIAEYIKNIEGIYSARVILSPFWVRKVPANRNKIEFELQYE